MVKVLLLSDTHGYIDDNMLKYVNQADEVWHVGDIGHTKVIKALKNLKPLRAVFGNIDSIKIRKEFPLNNIFTIEEVNVIMTHIGGYPSRYTKHAKQLLQKNTPNLFISGHSHILRVMYDKKLRLLHINPGAAGKEGFHQIRTMVRFEISQKEIKNLEVIELGKRGLII